MKANIGHAGSSGIQLHSMGPLYPYTVRGIGNALQCFNMLNGKEGKRHEYNFDIKGSFEAAHREAELDCQVQLNLDAVREFQEEHEMTFNEAASLRDMVNRPTPLLLVKRFIERVRITDKILSRCGS